jgi:hypothetical protein
MSGASELKGTEADEPRGKEVMEDADSAGHRIAQRRSRKQPCCARGSLGRYRFSWFSSSEKDVGLIDLAQRESRLLVPHRSILD